MILVRVSVTSRCIWGRLLIRQGVPWAHSFVVPRTWRPTSQSRHRWAAVHAMGPAHMWVQRAREPGSLPSCCNPPQDRTLILLCRLSVCSPVLSASLNWHLSPCVLAPLILFYSTACSSVLAAEMWVLWELAAYCSRSSWTLHMGREGSMFFKHGLERMHGNFAGDPVSLGLLWRKI